MLLKTPTILFILCGTIALTACHQKSYTKFEESITEPNKAIFRARMIGAENENFVYAVCEDTGKFYQFDPRHCNVTIQKEAQKRTCHVHVASQDAATEYLSELIFYPFGDDKVIITWMNNRDWRVLATEFKILDISTCQLIDVLIPADKIVYVVPYKNAADIGFRNKTYCASGNCKITINMKGEQISGPTDVLKNVDKSFNYPIGLVNPNSPDEGFYMSVGLKSEFGHVEEYEHFYKINGQGKSVEFMISGSSKYARPSSSHELFGFCYTIGKANTSIICTQYDKSLKLKLNKTLEFEDGQLQRWLQPYNLKKGGFLLVTGAAKDAENKYYDTFSMIKIDQDGKTYEEVKVDNLNFNCLFINSMHVTVLENESGEICAHFSCTHEETDKGQSLRKLQLAIKCLSKAYL